MSTSPEKSPREIIDAYSPIVRGHKGLLGLALKTIARPLEIARNVLGALTRYPIGFGYENAAGQILTDCPAAVADAFSHMEKKLQTSFNTAARNDASPIERETFLRVAEDVRADSDALSKHCTILRTEFDSVTERYNFVVMKEPLGKGAYKKLNLEESVAAIKRQIHGAAFDVAVGTEAKNPVTIHRKPLDLKNIEQPGS
jgi:hypothetical protein